MSEKYIKLKDCISREVIQDALLQRISRLNADGEIKFASELIKFKKYIDSLSPVVADRPKGEWIKNDMFECDQCHHRMVVGDGAYNYCPNCGSHNGDGEC